MSERLGYQTAWLCNALNEEIERRAQADIEFMNERVDELVLRGISDEALKTLLANAYAEAKRRGLGDA